MRDLWIRRIFSVLLGGACGVYTPGNARWLVLGLFLLVGIRVNLWKPRDFFARSLRPEILLLTGGVLAGLLYGFTAMERLQAPLLIERVQIGGLLREWTTNDDGATGIFEITEPLVSGAQAEGLENLIGRSYRLKVYAKTDKQLPESWKIVQPGDTLRFAAKLEQPKPPGTIGQFDLPLYYAVRGLAGGLTAQGDAELILTGEPPFSWQVRHRVSELMAQIPLSAVEQKQTAVLEGILFGDTGRIPEQDLERYRITGVYHVFSASGSNVAFLLLLCWGVTWYLPKTLRVGLCIAALVFYAQLCGGNPPIQRATIMAVFVLCGRLCGGHGHTRRALFAAGLALFVWQPLYLKDIGFQLSFLATWGILDLSPLIRKRKGIIGLPHVWQNALAASLASQVATLPLLISAFHRLSLIALPMNLLVLFLIGSVFELGIIGVVFAALFPTAALVFFQTALWLLAAVNEFLFRMAVIPWADAWVVNPGPLLWIYWYGGLAVLLQGRERVWFMITVWRMNLKKWLEPATAEFRRVLKMILTEKCRQRLQKICVLCRLLGTRVGQFALSGTRILLILPLALLLWSPWNTPRMLEVTFIDVGQGDAILIETPNGLKILVDTGPKSERFDAGERIVLPYLLNRGIRHLDALILTHAHSDHVGGAEAVLKAIPCDWVGLPKDGERWMNFSAAPQLNSGRKNDAYAGNRGTETEKTGLEPGLVKILKTMERKELRSGDRLRLEQDIQLEVLAPAESLAGTRSDENNNSLVLRLAHSGAQSVLLTADMEEEEMAVLSKTGRDYSADLFKVPHHGSRYSLVAEWLEKIEPKAVVIPVGKNSFGHPHPAVINYWRERRIPLYRTDEDGTIRVRLDATRIEIIPGRLNVLGN